MKITDRDYAAADKIALGQPFTCFDCRDQLAEIIARTRLAAYEEAAKVCEETEISFLSPEYAIGQPISSFRERFACRQCAEEIRQLGEQ